MNRNTKPSSSRRLGAVLETWRPRSWMTCAAMVAVALGLAQPASASGAPPTFVSVPGDQTTAEDVPLTALSVVINDAESDSLTLSAVSGNQVLIPNANLSVVPSSGGAGTYTRALSITPVANRHGGPVLVTLTLFDGSSSVQTSFNVTVSEVNDVPLVAGDALSAVAEDSGSRVISTASLLANDSTGPLESEQTLAVSAVGAAVGGTVSLGGGNVTFTPAADFNGAASFSYTATDNGTTSGGADPQSASATVSFTVTEVNDTPDAVDDALSAIAEDSGDRTISFGALLGNDSRGPANEGGQGLTVSAVLAATGGTVSIVGTDVVFAPAANFNGAASFNYTATDNGSTNGTPDPLSDSATVTFTITAVNDAPDAVDDVATVAEDSGANTIAVLANDTDVESSPLTITAVSGAANGTVVNNGTDVSYTPNADFFGSDSFTYTISDGDLDDTATVNVTVGEVNDAPTAVDDTLSAIAEDSGNRTLAIASLTANDSAGPASESGQALTITAAGNAVGGTVSVVGPNVVFVPGTDFNGAASFDYTLSDNGTTGGAPAPLTDTGTVTFAITEVNDTPDAVDDALSAIAEDSGDRTISFSALVGNDSRGPANEGGQGLTVSAVLAGTGGTVTIVGTDVVFTPTAHFNGTASFSYTATDNGTTNGSPDPLSDTATASFTITAVNDPPVAVDDTLTTAEDTAGTLNLVANDTDLDLDTLVVSAVTPGANGTVTFAGGSVTYTPAANFNGIDSFTYTVSDGNATDTGTVNVTVTAVNDAPDAVDDALSAIAEDSGNRTISFVALLGNDSRGPANEGGQGLTVSAVLAATGGTVSIVGTDVIFAPAANFNGTASFSYTATDNGTTNGSPDPLSDTATVSFAVTGVNDPPSAVDDTLTTAEDTAGTVNVVANDSDLDLDTLVVSAVTPGANGTVTFAGSSVTYTPVANFNGIDSFDYTVSDGNGGTDTGTVNVTVTEVNDTPDAVDDALSAIAEDSGDRTISFGALLGNDSRGPANEGGQGLTVSAVLAATGGTVSIVGTDVVFAPAANFNGAASFNYTATDNGSTNGTPDPLSDSATVTFTITAVNDAPDAVDDVATVAEDSGANTIAVLANDTDVESSPLTITAVSGATNGTVVNNGTDVSYTPNADFFGSDSFTYTISDGDLDDTATVNVTVGEVNDAPTAVDDTLSAIAEDSGNRTLAIASLTANDSAGPASESGQALTITAAGNAVGGTVSVVGPNVVFVPGTDFNGAASFDYTLSDNGTTGGAPAPLTDTGTVTFAITEVNDTPDAVDDALSAIAEDSGDRTISFSALVGNDSRGPANEGGQGLTVSAVLAGTGGTVTIVGTDVVFTPTAHFNGTASFSYTATDNGTTNGSPDPLSDTATASFTITAVNDPPVAVDDTLTTAEDTAGTLNLVANDTDLDLDTLVVSAVTPGANGTVTFAGGSVTYTPAANFNGIDSFDYTVSDGNATDTGTVNVTVTAVNDAPDAVNDVAITPEDTTAVVSVLANDTDVELDTLTVTATTNGANGTVTTNGTTVSYVPNLNFNGADAFTYTISDGNGGSDTASVNITVTPVNDDPVFVVSPANIASVLEDSTSGPLTVTLADVDGDAVTLTAASGNQALVPNASIGLGGSGYNRSVTFTTAPDKNSDTSVDDYVEISLVIFDGNGGSNNAAFTVNQVVPVNDPPSFAVPVSTATVAEDSGAQTVAGFATARVVGPTTADDELATQALTAFDIAALSSSPTLSFSAGPSINPATGALSYTAAANAFGTATFTAVLIDNGANGTPNGDNGRSAPIGFTIVVTNVNDPPVAVDDALTTAEDTAGTVNVVANDTDLDLDTLAVSAVTQGANGTVSFAGGSVTYTPAANFNGSDTFNYTVSDGNGGSDTGAVSVTVTAVNDPPVAVDDALTTAEDTAGTVNVVANDTDVEGNALAVSAVSQGTNGTVTFAGGSVTYTPAANFNGSDAFTYTVSDGNGGSDIGAVSVTVTAVNDPPVAVDDTLTTAEDTAGTVNVVANDTDVDLQTLTVSAVTQGANGTVSFAGGSVTYTPAANFNGSDTFNYTVSDGNGGSDTGAVSVTVTAVNDPPVAVDDALTTAEDTAGTVNVVANDTDVDLQTLTVSAVTQGANGTVSFAGGSVTYTPAANFNGSDTFNYTVSDGNGGSDTGAVSVTVTAVNDPPVAVDDALTTAEDTAGTVNVVANDTDVDLQTLTVFAVTQGANGTVSFAGGSVTYTPAANFNGSDTFNYTVSDGNGGSDTGAVSVTVTAVNDPPVAVDDALTTAEDTAGTVNVVANDTDVDLQTLTVSAVTQGTNGTVSFAGGSVTYTPAANFNGSDAFTYTVSDGNGGSDIGAVSVTVTAVNDPPVAVDDTLTTAEDTAGSVNVVANDTDVEGNALAVSAVSQGTNGTVTFAGGSVTYTPAANFNGSDAFTYTVSDGNGGSDIGAVSVTVTAVNDPPVAVDDTLTTAEDTAGTVNVVANDTDVDLQTLTVSAVTQGANGTVSFAGGSVTYTPAANFNGSDTFNYTVSDGNGGSDTGAVSVTVTAANDAPVLTPTTFPVLENSANGTLVGALIANDPDTGQTLVYSIGTGNTDGAFAIDPANGNLTVANTAALDFELNPSFALTIRATDNGVPPLFGEALATVNLTNVDEAPTATPQTLTTLEDATLSITLAGNDPEGATLAFEITTAPTNGTLTGTAPNLTYTPNADFNGSDSFAFTVSDPSAQESAPATVAIDVLSVNDRPSFSNLGARANAAGTIGAISTPAWAFNVVLGPANESAQAVLAYSAVEFSDPSNVVSAVAVTSTGTLQYTLTGSSGVAEIDITLRDTGGTANGGVDISTTARLLIGAGIEADLAVTKSNGVSAIEEQQLVVYTIVASNNGTAGVTAARVTDLMPAEFTGVTWTCTATGGATCPAAGSGDIDVAVNLPIGSSVTFLASGTVQGASGDFIENTAFVEPPPAVFDPNLANNEATDSDVAQLFADEFEDP